MAETLASISISLGAHTAEFVESFRKAQAALSDTGKQIEVMAGQATTQARRLVKVHEEMNLEIVNLTGTATERELAALDAREKKLVARYRKAGLEVVRLEEAFAEKRRQIRLKSAQEEAAAGGLGSDAGVRGLRALRAAQGGVAEATGNVNRRIEAFGKLARVAGAQAQQFTGGMSFMATAGLTPVTGGLALVAAALVYLTDKFDEARQRNLDFLATTSQGRLGLRNLAIDLAVAREEFDKGTGSIKKHEEKIAEMARRLEELNRAAADLEGRAGPDIQGKAKDAREKANALAAEYDVAVRELPIVKELDEIERAREKRTFERSLEANARRLRLEREILDVTGAEATYRERVFSINEKYAEQVRDLKNDEEGRLRRAALEFQKGLELETLRDRAYADAKRQGTETVARLEEEVRLQRMAADVTQEAALAHSRIDAATAERIRKLREATIEIQRQEPAYRDLERRILAVGEAEKRLHDAAAARKKAEEILAIETELAAALLELQVRAAGIDVEIATAAARAEADLAAQSGVAQTAEAKRLLEAKLVLLKLTQEQELRDLELHYADLLKRAEAAGQDTLALTAQIEEARLAIIRQSLAAERAAKQEFSSSTAPPPAPEGGEEGGGEESAPAAPVERAAARLSLSVPSIAASLSSSIPSLHATSDAFDALGSSIHGAAQQAAAVEPAFLEAMRRYEEALAIVNRTMVVNDARPRVGQSWSEAYRAAWGSSPMFTPSSVDLRAWQLKNDELARAFDIVESGPPRADDFLKIKIENDESDLVGVGVRVGRGALVVRISSDIATGGPIAQTLETMYPALRRGGGAAL